MKVLSKVQCKIGTDALLVGTRPLKILNTSILTFTQNLKLTRFCR